jgi:hypothetical protein
MKTLQFKSGTILPVDTALPSAVFGALTANGVKGFVFPRQSAFSIPLSPVIDSSTWVIKTDSASTNTVYDTLVLYYKRQQQFISNACGYAYFFNLDSISTTHNFIDSILIINASVTNNVNANNLQVYIHPGS